MASTTVLTWIHSLCPLMALSMTLQYMDKQALPAASILGIIQDLVNLSPLSFWDFSAHPVCRICRVVNIHGLARSSISGTSPSRMQRHI